jgi:hypothetical protein
MSCERTHCKLIVLLLCHDGSLLYRQRKFLCRFRNHLGPQNLPHSLHNLHHNHQMCQYPNMDSRWDIHTYPDLHGTH